MSESRGATGRLVGIGAKRTSATVPIDLGLLRESIDRGCEALELVLPPGSVGALGHYVDLLARWNRVFNLTAVRNPEDMVSRHVLDSLAVAPHIRGPRVLDVGSGAGLPGIPLALVLPNFRFVLLDASAKRTRFLTQVRAELGLSQVAVEHLRVEHYRPQEPFDTVVSRAFSSAVEFVRLTGDLCAPEGQVVAMQGRLDATLSSGAWNATAYRIHVPGLDARRHAYVFRRESCR